MIRSTRPHANVHGRGASTTSVKGGSTTTERLVLSRKGFDSAAGHGFSPYDRLFDGLDIPGAGYFPILDRSQVLSHRDPSVTSRVWALPRFFIDQKPIYFPKAPEDWRAEGDIWYVKAPARGQEFVTDLTEPAIAWVRSMFGI